MTSSPQKDYVSPRWFKFLILGIVLLFVVGGAWFFLFQQGHQRRTVEDNLRSIANLKAWQIAEWRSERIADGLALMTHIALVESLERYFSGEVDRELPKIIRRLRPFIDQDDYENILLLDTEKQVRLSLEQGTAIADGYEGNLSTLEAAIAARRPVWTPVHMEAVHSTPHMSVVVPLFSHVDDEHYVGALVLISQAAHYLYPLIQSWPIPSDSAETLLVRRDGDDVLFLNELRHQEDTALKLRIPMSRSDLPAARALSGETGIVEGLDYRGVKVIAAILPIEGSPWSIVAKVDATEAFAEWRFRSIMILVFLFVGLGLVVVAWFLVGQRNKKAHYRRLYKSETDLSHVLRRQAITLQAIGDGVISTDAEGRVEIMNRMAEKLTGWRLDEARGKDLTEVLQLVVEETRAPLESPAVQAIREGRIVGLPDTVLLVSRDGKEIPVADSTSPIRDEDGAVVGAVLVFNDQTEEREYQKKIVENEEKYRLLADNTLDVIWTLNRDLVFTYVNPAIREHSGFEPEEYIGTHLREHCGEEQFAKMMALLSKEATRFLEHEGVLLESEMLRKDGSSFPVEIRALIQFDDEGNSLGVQGTARDISERARRDRELKNLQAELAEAQKMQAIGRLAGGVAHDYNNMLNIIIGYAELGMAQVDPENPLHANFSEIIEAANRSAGITRKLLAFARKQMVEGKIIDLGLELTGMEETLKRQLGDNIELLLEPGSDLWPVKMDPSQLEQVVSNLCANAGDAIDGSGRVTIETENVSFDAGLIASRPGATPGDFVMLSVNDDGRGMDDATIENIFEPFFTTKPFGESAGLGLAVVYGIVKQNRGFVDIKSTPEEGASFRLYFPRHLDDT